MGVFRLKNLIIKLNILILLMVLSAAFLGTKVSAESSYSECPQIMSMIAEKPNKVNDHLAKAALFCLEKEMHQTQNQIDSCLVAGNVFCVSKAKHESAIIESIIKKFRQVAQKENQIREREVVAKVNSDYRKI